MPEADPEVTKFLNERVRPAAEQMKALRVSLEDSVAKWDAVKDKVPNDGTVIDDGRAPQGITQMTGEQVHALAAAAQTVLGTLNAASDNVVVASAVTAAQVRPLGDLI